MSYVCVCVCVSVFVGVLGTVFMHACICVYDLPVYLFIHMCVYMVIISFPSLTISEYVKCGPCCEESYLFVLKFVHHQKMVVHLEEKIMFLQMQLNLQETQEKLQAVEAEKTKLASKCEEIQNSCDQLKDQLNSNQQQQHEEEVCVAIT